MISFGHSDALDRKSALDLIELAFIYFLAWIIGKSLLIPPCKGSQRWMHG
jgi:hypothetical protein